MVFEFFVVSEIKVTIFREFLFLLVLLKFYQNILSTLGSEKMCLGFSIDSDVNKIDVVLSAPMLLHKRHVKAAACKRGGM
jgi:ABC-type amino acid transport system permease subunit